MQRNVIISENSFIQDLGMGYSYVNFGRTIETIEGEQVIIADYQFRIENPATREGIELKIADYPELAEEFTSENNLNHYK